MSRNPVILLLGGILLLAVLGGAVILTHNVLTQRFPGHNDFMSRWEGARSYWIDGLNPYGAQASLNIQEAIYGRAAVEGEDPGYFAYPFFVTLLVWPLVHTTYAWASAVWMVLLEASLIVSLLLLFDLFRWRPRPGMLALLLIWVLAFYYSARGLILGQPGLLVCFLEVLALWALARNRDGLAGAALALSTLKPQMGFLIVPFLLLWGLRERRIRFVTIFAAVFGALMVISFLIQPSWVGDWLEQLRLYPSYTALGSPVWIITSYYLGLGGWAELAVSGLLVIVMLWAWYSVLVKRQTERFLWAAVLTLTITHLIAPRTATPHYVVFLIPLVFYAAHLSRVNWRGSQWIIVGLAVLLVVPWVHFLATVTGEFEHPTVYLPLPIAILVILLWTRRLWWRFSATTTIAKQETR